VVNVVVSYKQGLRQPTAVSPLGPTRHAARRASLISAHQVSSRCRRDHATHCDGGSRPLLHPDRYSPGVTASDVLRWIGVAVAVAGVVLTTPDGIASARRTVKDRRRQAWAAAKRMLRRPGGVVGVGGLAAKGMTMTGRGHVDVWQPWREEACDPTKIDILHKQVVMLKGRIDELRKQADRTADELRKEIHEAEGRVTGDVQQLTGEFRSQRTQSSRVDARGLGPIALGIILTGLPDELARMEPLGWLIAAVAIIWTFMVFPSWWRDYKRAMEDRAS
jgi:hypothetical protein